MCTMGKKKIRLPDSDSEDEYDGFYFSDSLTGTKKSLPCPVVVHDPEQELYNAVRMGDNDQLQRQVDLLDFDVNLPIKGSYTLLMHACSYGHLDIVRYLVEEKRAKVNEQVDSYVPLMLACGNTTLEEPILMQLVQLLLQHGADINLADRHGTTSFMLVCKNGYVNVARFMLKDVNCNAEDNEGYTPLFHAVENNRSEVVRLLVEAGVATSTTNAKGYTPLQVAQYHGFYDLIEFLPQSERHNAYMVPTQYISYHTLRDCIPSIFLKSDCPEYFQEINTILLSLGLEHCLEYFAKGRVSLAEFLVMDEAKLQRLGVQQAVHRMQILRGLLDFHLHYWSTSVFARVNDDLEENFYDILMITANQLQHLVIIKASLRFIRQQLMQNNLGLLNRDQQLSMQRTLNSYRGTVKDLRSTVKYLASFSPRQNPLYINFNEIVAERRRSKWCIYLKYSTLIIGISVVVCLKFNKYF